MQLTTMSTLLLVVAMLFVGVVSFVTLRPRHPLRMPPGPPRRYFGDNGKDVPSIQPWKTFAAWNQKYGPVISFYLGSTPVIVLGTNKAAWDLLEKRGDIYSSRPRSIMSHEILSDGMRGISMPYGPRWRNWRSVMHAGLNSTTSLTYRPLQSLESSVLLRDLLREKNPMHFGLHLQRYVTSVVSCVTYGRRVKRLDDEIVLSNQRTEKYFIKVNLPGRYLVESWPILLALPRALQWFRWEPERHRAMDTELYMSLMNNVKRQMNIGTAQPSIATVALEKQAQFGLNNVETAFALSAPWAAGVGTTMASFEVFMMAMLLYPSVMRKAQGELDSIIGRDRLPDFSDAESLPYIQSLIKETTRWRPIIPTGFPHAVTSDNTYEGMFIPKGSTVYTNIYAIMRDPEMFPEPEEFRPERFLDNDDPRFVHFTLGFGFGRRICPGMHLALHSLYINVARILWAFDILPPSDEQGKHILPSPHSFTTGLISHPVPFKYLLVPRNQALCDLVVEEAGRAELELAAWQ